MDVLEAIHTRRSIRRFTADPVTDAELDVVLRAAMAAPSASNERPWRFVVVRDREVLDRLARTTPFAGLLGGAPACVVVCADKAGARYPWFWDLDCSAATQNALLAAHAIGLGGVWIGVHAFAPFVSGVRRIIRAPRRVVPVSMIALGHPAETRPPIDRYDPAWVHENAW
jgi:nitroreductase